MFDSMTLIVGAVTRRLVARYRRVFGRREPDHAGAIATAARVALERIGTSDAPYHDLDHTVMVALLGTDLLRGREIAEVVTPDDWLHTTVALLCHDVGYVRGACRGDTATEVVVDLRAPGCRRRAAPRTRGSRLTTSTAPSCSSASAPGSWTASTRSGWRGPSS